MTGTPAIIHKVIPGRNLGPEFKVSALTLAFGGIYDRLDGAGCRIRYIRPFSRVSPEKARHQTIYNSDGGRSNSSKATPTGA